MLYKRSAVRFSPQVTSQAEIVFQGLSKFDGKLKDISKHAAFFYTDASSADSSKCFLRLQTLGKEYYSRGTVIRKDARGIVLHLENWFPVFSELVKQDVFSGGSTLNQILNYKKNVKEIESAAKLHARQKLVNCWEKFNCGKENFCAAGTHAQYDGYFGGKNGGRFCAFIPDTLCKDGLTRTAADKARLCAACPHYNDIINDILSNSATSPPT